MNSKEYQKLYQREYMKKPEVIAKKRIYFKDYYAKNKEIYRVANSKYRKTQRGREVLKASYLRHRNYYIKYARMYRKRNKQ